MQKYYRNPISNFSEKELKFQAIEWLEFNEDINIEDGERMSIDGEYTVENKENEKYIIRVFGVNKNGNSVCLNIHNFTPFFYIKVPDNWKSQNVKIFLSKLSDSLSKSKKKIDEIWKTFDFSNNIITKKCVLQLKKDFYGFSNNKEYKFLRLTFDNSEAMKKAISIIKSHNIGNKKLSGFSNLPLYEANLDPVIKFAHIKNLKFTGWLNVKDFDIVNNESSKSTCQIECNTYWSNVILDEDNSNAPILQASYDIETYSIDGSFPSPNIKGNVITQIATSFKFFGQTEFYLKHIICLKKCSPLDDPNTILECYDTEEQLLLAWTRLINKMDPDILYQYNGDQFDGNYLYTRAILLNCEDFLLLGKLKNIPSTLYKSTFSSSAYGNTSFKRLVIPGRINFDILIYIKREYKENSYKLDYISEKYLGQNKNPVTPQMMFKYFKEGDPDKIKLVAEYCIVDTMLPQKLVDKMHILQNQISMSNVTYVPIRYLIERGQQIKVFSQILKETRKQNFLVPTIDNYSKDSDDEDSFTGATVLPPLKGAYYEPITVCDFASLYPSIIRAHNLCFSTIVLDNSFDNIEGIDYKVIEWDDTTYDKTIHHCFKYVQNNEGILPKLLAELTVARKDYKKLMNSTDDPFLSEVYNKCQMAVKVSMNSIYGFLAAPMLCCKPIAATVTAIGRNMIKDTKEYMEKKYPGSLAVYGDTDSVFVKFKTPTSEKYSSALQLFNNGGDFDKNELELLKIKCIQEAIDLGKIAAKNATQDLFKFPINLEYEKVYCPLLLLSKKRYIGMYYSNNPGKPDKMDNKGVVLTRRDNFDLLKKTYSTVIDIIMKEGICGVQKTKDYIQDILYKISNNEFTNLDDFIISKTLKDNYKTKNIPHLVLARKINDRDPGSAPKSNDRVPYVFTYPDIDTQAGKAMIEYIDVKRKEEFIEKVSERSEKKINSFEEALEINKKLQKKVLLKKGKLNQYEKVEDPDYMLKNNLPLDAEYYISFMKTSLCEILSLFIDNSEKIFDNIINEHKNSKW